MITLAQTLHGYRDGHRLLATGGDVDRAELGLLDRLTDLSGYLPEGVAFDVYHTGYPCGRYYAFASTWLDRLAQRGGAVVTHTFLVPVESLSAMNDPWALCRFHRQPLAAGDAGSFELYRSVIEVSPAVTAGECAMPSDDCLAIFFGQPDRPIIRVSDAPPSETVRRLWAMLWPAARMKFSFCTLALRPLLLGRRPFDFLGVPPAARNAFHELARSRSWWVDDQPRPVALDSPWLDRLRREGRSALLRIVHDWETDGFAVRPDRVPLLARLEELTEAAGSRLAAARSQADLLAQVEPSGTHPNWVTAIELLIEQQAQAAIEPRPLWELSDLLGRPQLGPVLAAQPRLEERLRARLAEQIAYRLEAAPASTAAALPALIDAAARYVPRRELLDIVECAVLGCPDGITAASAILTTAAAAGTVDLAVAALRPLPKGERQTCLETLDVSAEWVRTVAAETGDIHLLPLTFSDPVSAADLHRLTRAWSALGQLERPSVASLLGRVDHRRVITWALEDIEAPPDAAMAFAVEVLRTGGISLAELARMAERAYRGWPLFEQAAATAGRSGIEAAFREAPGLVIPALDSSFRALYEVAILQAPAAALCRVDLIKRLAPGSSFPIRNRWVKAIFAAAVRGEVPVEQASACLTCRREFLERVESLDRAQLLAEVDGSCRISARLLPLVIAMTQDIIKEYTPTGMLSRVVVRLLRMALDTASGAELDAATDGLKWVLNVQWPKDSRRELASVVAHAVRVTANSRALELLKVSFADLHRSIRKGRSWTIFWMWPVAKQKDVVEWERWLVKLARERGWSRADVLSCGGDSDKACDGLRQAWDEAT